MSLSIRKCYAAIAVVGAAVIAFGGIAYAAGLRVNTTKSVPLGFYWTSSAPVEKGAYVMFCPPDAGAFAVAKERGYIPGGFCPGDYGYMMKRILAAKGDTVEVTEDGVYVDGERLALSRPRTADPAGRPLPRYPATRYTLADDELLLMSDVSDTSFDSRYFGPVNRSQIRTVIRPIFTW